MSKYQPHMIISTNTDNNSVATSSTTINHEISGYLFKKTMSGTYQKRYFEINGTYLTYYKTDKMTKLLAALSIAQVGAIRLLGEVEDGVEFEIDLKDRKYVLRAETLSDAKKWVSYLIEIRDQKSTINNNNQMINFSNNTDDRTPLSNKVTIASPAVIHKSSRNCCAYIFRRFC